MFTFFEILYFIFLDWISSSSDNQSYYSFNKITEKQLKDLENEKKKEEEKRKMLGSHNQQLRLIIITVGDR